MFGRWEWIILELLFLGLLIAELISIRRAKQDEDRGKTGR